MKSKILSLAMGAMLAVCTATAATDAFKITAEMPTDELNGYIAYLVNFDTKAKVDSTTIADGKAIFTGTVENPYLARIMADGRPMAQLIVEPGEITSSRSGITGGPLNQENNSLQKRVTELGNQYQSLPKDSTYQYRAQTILDQYDALMDSAFEANADNPIGYSIFLDKAYSLSLPELNAALEKHPALKGYDRINKLITAATNKEATSPGHKFVDFTVTNDSISQKFSDYVGKGKPVLVDFWASWCGPCIRETAVIKDLLNQYGPQGLEVLGVAVWDEPQNTLKAIETHKLPWQQIINAQTIPTDIYGISAIPCILIIGPDGTILSRDKQDEELRADVEAVMNGTLTPATLLPSEPTDSVSAN